MRVLLGEYYMTSESVWGENIFKSSWYIETFDSLTQQSLWMMATNVHYQAGIFLFCFVMLSAGLQVEVKSLKYCGKTFLPYLMNY